jgi:hypothetical protein
VDYVNLDWRIIRDDFRVPSATPYQQKLILSGLKVKGEQDVDSTAFAGLAINVRNAAGTANEQRDLILVDTETGGIYSPEGYAIDKSNGVVRFIDLDNNAGNGLLGSKIFWPGATASTAVPDIKGRSVRALYMTKGEWAVQPVKASTIYNTTFNPGSLSHDQCFPGLADGTSGRADTVYFPLADIGKKVMIGELWYRDGAGAVKIMEDQEFTIQAAKQGDLRYGRVVITDRVPNSTLDYSNGYCVRRVRGASVSVRVAFNVSYIKLVPDSATNLSELNRWLGSLKRVETETFLMKGDQDQ